MLNKSQLIFIILFIFVLIIVFVPPLVYFTNFTGGLSKNSTEWSNFGSYLSGTSGSILSALSLFALIYTLLKTSEDNKKNQELTMLALRNATEQNHLIKRELMIKLMEDKLESINDTLSNVQYKAIVFGTLDNVDEDLFFEIACTKLSELARKEISSGGSFKLHLAAKTLKEIGMDYEDEHLQFYYILDFIDKCTEEDIRAELINLYRSRIDKDRAFWLVSYSVGRNESTKELMLKYDGKLLMIPRYIAGIMSSLRSESAHE